jgi:hypothetical protein
MTGNFAPRNSWKQAKANYYGETQQNASASRAASGMCRLSAYATCLRGQGSRMAMGNSCRELVMPMEKHQPQGRLPAAAYCPRQL